MLRVALEGPVEGIDDIIGDVVPLWENDCKYRFLYANPSSYLNSPNSLCLFGVVDTNGSGTHIS